MAWKPPNSMIVETGVDDDIAQRYRIQELVGEDGPSALISRRDDDGKWRGVEVMEGFSACGAVSRVWCLAREEQRQRDNKLLDAIFDGPFLFNPDWDYRLKCGCRRCIADYKNDRWHQGREGRSGVMERTTRLASACRTCGDWHCPKSGNHDRDCQTTPRPPRTPASAPAPTAASRRALPAS